MCFVSEGKPEHGISKKKKKMKKKGRKEGKVE